MTIVVVEDDAATTLLLEGVLAPLRRPLLTFDDPTAALDHLAGHEVGLVVTDFLMPRLDGAELVRRIRALPRNAAVPVLMVTVAEDRALRMRAFDAGVTDFITKPVDPLETLARTRALLRLADAQRQLRFRAERLAGEAAEAAAALEIREQERQEMLHQLFAGERFRAVAQLSSGLAHDFNNLLSVVSAAAYSLQQGLPGHPLVAEATQPMLAAVERGAELIQQMLAYSRRQTLHAAAFDMGAELAETRLVLARTAGPEARLEFDLAPGPMPLLADRAQFLAAVMNLIANAREATGGQGPILLRTWREEGREEGRELGPEGARAVLEVRDGGAGMDAATAARAFEPFFTTRSPAGGTGLGLPMVHGFVHQSGGTVALDSAPGQGTAIRLSFPLLATGPAAAAHAPPAHGPAANNPVPPAASSGALRVLLVDDNTVLSAMLGKALAAEGLSVAAASSADAAADLLQSEHFAAVVTDVVMPGEMDGIDLGRWLRLHRPRTGVVIASGYAGTALPSDLAADPAVRFLAKPLHGARLLEALHQVAAAGRMAPGG